ncbi:urease accessory protein UreD [Marinicrinis sediminis]|uniref:Urease accessory protein UreD n=1 Tax=Marinicrinis sediminis TaxID=1652465 RepID=A0ABW5R921_9BACL
MTTHTMNTQLTQKENISLIQKEDTTRLVNSRLYGQFSNRQGRTTLVDRYVEAPMKISKTHRMNDDETLYVCMMDASPGLLDGDEYDIRLTLQEDSKVYFTNQSSTKVHPARQRGSRLIQRLDLAPRARLELMPEPTIPYADSSLHAATTVHLSEGCQFAYADIVAPGRSSFGEQFDFHSYKSTLDIYWESRRVACERIAFSPLIHPPNALSSLHRFSHYGTMWLMSEDDYAPFIEQLRSEESHEPLQDMEAGMSLLAEKGMIIRAVAMNSWRLQQFFHSIWTAWRKEICGNTAPPVRK